MPKYHPRVTTVVRIKKSSKRSNMKPTRKFKKIWNAKGFFEVTRGMNDNIIAYQTTTIGVPQILINAGTPITPPLVFGGVGISPAVVPGGNLYNVPFAFTFAMDQISAYSELISIADQYKLCAVRIKITYNANNIAGGQYSLFSTPTIKYITDYDDGDVLSPNLIQQKMGLKSHLMDKPLTIVVRPKVASSAFQSGTVNTGFLQPSKAMWCDSGYPSIQHYGLKGYIENWDLSNTSVVTQLSMFTFELTYDVKCKDLQ